MRALFIGPENKRTVVLGISPENVKRMDNGEPIHIDLHDFVGGNSGEDVTPVDELFFFSLSSPEAMDFVVQTIKQATAGR